MKEKEAFNIKRTDYAGVMMVLTAAIVLFAGILHWALKPVTWTLIQYPDMTDTQGLFYSLKNDKTGELVIVDGGWEGNEAQVRNVILNNGGIVDHWFITHFHADHVGAFNRIYYEPGNIKIKNIYCPDPELDMYLEKAEWWDEPQFFTAFKQITDGDKRIKHPQRGDEFNAAGLKVKIFNTFDNTLLDVLNPEGQDLLNNTSLVFKLSGKEDSIIYFGDVHNAEMADYFTKEFKDDMSATYIQLGHHGNNSLPVEFYESIAPKVAFFDAPEWLMTGGDYNCGWYVFRFDEAGIEHYDYRTGVNIFTFR